VLLRVCAQKSVAATKNLLRNICVVLRSWVLVICSNWVTEQECGHTKALPLSFVGCVKSELRRSCCRNAQVASLCRITQHQLLRFDIDI
jgi:hypothetical protein